jgi:hypothetical protein
MGLWMSTDCQARSHAHTEDGALLVSAVGVIPERLLHFECFEELGGPTQEQRPEIAPRALCRSLPRRSRISPSVKKRCGDLMAPSKLEQNARVL